MSVQASRASSTVLKAGPQHGRDALSAAALQGERSLSIQSWGPHTGAGLSQNLPVLSLPCLRLQSSVTCPSDGMVP